MNNIESLKNAIDLGIKALSLLKGVKDLLPNSPKKTEAIKALEEAEKTFKIAESQAAKELGYKLCQCTWPPQIMLLTGTKYHFKCSNCEREIDTSQRPRISVSRK